MRIDPSTDHYKSVLVIYVAENNTHTHIHTRTRARTQTLIRENQFQIRITMFRQGLCIERINSEKTFLAEAHEDDYKDTSVKIYRRQCTLCMSFSTRFTQHFFLYVAV